MKPRRDVSEVGNTGGNAAGAPPSKSAALRRMLQSERLEFLLEAHSGLSAKIAEEAGFRGIWASGLSISAACGVRDANELSWTQVLEVVEYMSDATSVPILLDGDTGYGNFNNVRRLVRKLEQRGVAGVCLEDKVFPKTNSFLEGPSQMLANVDEFAGKIKAAKDTQRDPDFSVVARVEAFVCGAGLAEALRRAEAYSLAGADAILIHSKQPTASEVLSFTRAWQDHCPLIVIPTTYWRTPTRVLEEASVRIVIWANHMMRSSLMAMQQAAATIMRDRGLASVEEWTAPLSEVFRLQDAAELKEAERNYLTPPRLQVVAGGKNHPSANEEARPVSIRSR